MIFRSEISQSLAQTSDTSEVTVSNASLELEPDKFSQDQNNSVSAQVYDDESPTEDQNDRETYRRGFFGTETKSAEALVHQSSTLVKEFCEKHFHFDMVSTYYKRVLILANL